MASVVNPLLAQPSHVLGIGAEARNSIIVSMRKVGGVVVVISRYGDIIWWLTGATTNTRKSDTKLDFGTIPVEFREAIKEVMYRFIRRGRAGQKRPRVGQLVRTLTNLKIFLQYVLDRGVRTISEISPVICSMYVQACKAETSRPGRGRRQGCGRMRPLAAGTIAKRLASVECLYELSQYTAHPMPHHPWPDTSAGFESGASRQRSTGEARTPLIPDDVFCALFQKAWQVVQGADRLLDIRDAMEKLKPENRNVSKFELDRLRKQVLDQYGFELGYKRLQSDLLEIRTACYIVVASVSGCRNHELAYVHSGSYYATEDDEGQRYWWMRSTSTKTDEGVTEWMIPEAAVTALKTMDRWAIPYQAKLRAEIEQLGKQHSSSLEVAEATSHLDAVFVGSGVGAPNTVRTIANTQWNVKLREFAQSCGLVWNLASHQFRRKFANYAARSQFGDLRYLKEHFKHWSIDMTLGYALNESQEMALYLEIEDELLDIKEEVVTQWLEPSEPLAGGYGKGIMSWRRRDESVVIFKDRRHMVRAIAESTAIRSNGHAWCTADDNQCVGNDLDRTRCGEDCRNSVIGRSHARIYQGQFDHLKELAELNDIGEGGMARVRRDMDRCANVLRSLGYQVQ